MTTTPVMTITDEQIAEIETSAKRATQGKWEVADGYYPSLKEIKGPSFNLSIVASATDLDFKDYMARTSDAEHIAACNPTTILALISRLRAAEKDAERYRWIRDTHNIGGCVTVMSDYDRTVDQVFGFENGNFDEAIDAAMEKSK